MIRTITTNLDKIVEKLESINSINSSLPGGIFSGKVKQTKLIEGIYMSINVVSDNPKFNSNKGPLLKIARLGFTIVGNSETVDKDLYNIVDVITNEIVDEGCSKIIDFNGFEVVGVEESSISSVLYDVNDIPYIVKDYLFTYYAK